MRHSLIVMSMLALGLAGCATAQIRKEASATLECPEGQIKLEDKGKGTYWATGCGKGALCEKPEVDGADVTCVGGAPTQAP